MSCLLVTCCFPPWNLFMVFLQAKQESTICSHAYAMVNLKVFFTERHLSTLFQALKGCICVNIENFSVFILWTLWVNVLLKRIPEGY